MASLASAARRLAALVSVPSRDVRSAALRVAVMATAIVAVAYLVVAGAVVMIVNRNLTTAVDSRLQARLNYYAGVAGQGSTGTSGLGATDHSLQEPLLSWAVLDSGDVIAASDPFSQNQALPNGMRSVSAASTVTFGNGSDVRAAGMSLRLRVDGVVHNAHIVVAQSLANVSATQHNILTAEVLIGPLLLLVVFLGAYTVGRRVGSPIERARQRQIALTADASHELRTPLSVIEAQTSLALERERDADWYRRAFQAVGVESGRMRRLVDDLLWLARFDNTREAPAAEPVDLGVLADQAAARFAAVAEARGQTLRVSVEAVSTVVNAPPEWLDRLLGVLLDNACRYTPAGGVIEVAVGRREGRVRLAVDDSGPGIPAAQRERIFDRFHRASDRAGGSGLGLAIAAAVVSGSAGRWDVADAALGGTSMAVSWAPLLRNPTIEVSPALQTTVTAPAAPLTSSRANSIADSTAPGGGATAAP